MELEDLKKLVVKYQVERPDYIKASYNETMLRRDFLDPLFELLGWDISNKSAMPTHEREVLLEEALKANASENSKKPDYTFRLFSERKFFLEAKKPSVQIQSDDICAKQARRYGYTAKLKISVLSNFEYLLIYDTSVPVDHEDSYNKALIKRYHFTEYEEKFDELKRLLGKNAVYSGAFDQVWQDVQTEVTHKTIDKIFLEQINRWRCILGQEIFKHCPELFDQELNNIVQSYLNRIIFLRVCEDRNIEDFQVLLALANREDFKLLIERFKLADRKFNSGLFDQFLKDKVIEDISSTFWDIIRELYYPESTYSFSVFSSDLLGNIYEIFLSEQLVTKNGTVSLEKKQEHLDKDVVTTPTFVIHSILRETVVERCRLKSDAEILNQKFADISCGSGAFLLELFQLLNDTLIDYYLTNDQTKLIRIGLNLFKLSFELKRKILLNCIFGVDKDYNAVEATKFGLLLKLLEGEDKSSTADYKPILPDLSGNVFFGNSLISNSWVQNRTHLVEINPFDFENLKFDVIIGNPPYLKSEDMKTITPYELPIYKDNFVTAYKQFDKYFLFIERGVKLLKDDGILGYIVPNKFTRVGAGKKLRNFLSSNGYLSKIISFGANQIFEDKTTYTSLIFIEHKKSDSFQFAEVRDLNSWKMRSVAATVLASKSHSELDDEVWVLVPPQLQATYDKIKNQSVSLMDLVGEENIFNGIQTSANPVYIFQPEKEDSVFYYFKKKNESFKIEKDLTKPYFQTSSGEDNLNTYRTFRPNARVIYPYHHTPDGIDVIPLLELKKQYPSGFNYLMQHESLLNNPKRDIKPEPKTKEEWHRFGRQQGLSISEKKEKIILGVLSNGNKYAIDKFGTLFTSGGTAGYCAVTLPPNLNYSIYYIQAILNSKYAEWFVILTGEVFRGGYFARGTKVLNNLPIRKIDFNNKLEKMAHNEVVNIQMQLIELQDKIDENINNKSVLIPLNRQFTLLRNKLDMLLKDLYSLGDRDAEIPLIKEYYETN